MTMMRSILWAAMLSSAALPVAAGETLGDGTPIRDEDTARLEALDRATGAALREVLGEGDDQLVAQAVAVLRGTPGPAGTVDPSTLAGEWSCRMTKIGGIAPLLSYPPFRCHIGADEGILQFEKLTGSQRTRGVIHQDGDAWVYLGSSFVQGEEPRAYADFPQQMDTQATETLPDVGVFEVTGPGTARILFPLPYRESVLNVLTLTR